VKYQADVVCYQGTKSQRVRDVFERIESAKTTIFYSPAPKGRSSLAAPPPPTVPPPLPPDSPLTRGLERFSLSPDRTVGQIEKHQSHKLANERLRCHLCRPLCQTDSPPGSARWERGSPRVSLSCQRCRKSAARRYPLAATLIRPSWSGKAVFTLDSLNTPLWWSGGFGPSVEAPFDVHRISRRHVEVTTSCTQHIESKKPPASKTGFAPWAHSLVSPAVSISQVGDAELRL